LIHLQRVALEIKSVGLYDLILQDVQKAADKKSVSEEDILQVLKRHPEILEAYKQTNLEYNISNIHLKDIVTNELSDACRNDAEQVNADLQHLRQIEKYTLDFEQSSVLVIIFSIEFFVLFSVQYFIVLLNLKEWQLEIYGLFAMSILFAWWYARKEKRLFDENSELYEEKYESTLKRIASMEDAGCIRKSDLVITECEEHV